MSEPKNLYVVVHHRRDSSQPFQNSWLDDNCLDAITTTKEIGDLCAMEKLQGKRIFVHRCGWANALPTICCSVLVAEIDSIGKRASLVGFSNPIVMNLPPNKSPLLGQSFYGE